MKIHCIEGLFCFHLRPLTKAVQSLNLGVEVVTYPWTVWNGSIDVKEDDIVCGHSFGANVAIKIWQGWGVGGRYLFILDGRIPPFGTSYKNKLWKDRNAYNYYQTGFVRGYPIEGAENHLVKGFSHYRMPRNPAFLFKLMEVVKSG